MSFNTTYGKRVLDGWLKEYFFDLYFRDQILMVFNMDLLKDELGSYNLAARICSAYSSPQVGSIEPIQGLYLILSR